MSRQLDTVSDAGARIPHEVSSRLGLCRGYAIPFVSFFGGKIRPDFGVNDAGILCRKAKPIIDDEPVVTGWSLDCVDADCF